MKKTISLLLAVCFVLLCAPCALAQCSVCGGDGACDQCLGLGFMMARVFGSDELVQVACGNPQCEDGRCTACGGEEAPVSGAYAFADASVESAVCAAVGKSAGRVTPADLQSLTHLDVEILSGPVLLDDLKQMPSLEELSIRCVSTRKLDMDLAPLSALERLRELTLSTTGEVSHFNVLLRLPKLEIISLEGTVQQLNLTGFLDQGMMTRAADGSLVLFDSWYEQTIYTQRFVQTAPNSALCSTCGGNGRQNLACRECDGKGAWECHACHGTGGYVCSVCTGGSLTCTMCKGSGMGSNARMCTYCRGLGKRDCYACNGNNLRRCGECLGAGEVYCSLCDKTGIKTLTCAACGGDGLR